MKLAFELIPKLATNVSPHHEFEMIVLLNGEEQQNTRGSDSFGYNAMVLAGKPLAATGRCAEHHFEPDLEGIKGICANTAEVLLPEESDAKAFTVRINNNYVLSQEMLQSFYSLNCIIDDKAYLIPLDSGLFPVSWDGLGVFNIDVSSLCDAFCKKSCANT